MTDARDPGGDPPEIQRTAPPEWAVPPAPPPPTPPPLGAPPPPLGAPPPPLGAPPLPHLAPLPGEARRRRRKPLGRRLAVALVQLMAVFVLGSVLWVLAYRVIDPPFTLTIAGDVACGQGVTRNWLAIDRIDRDMVRAAIGAEDAAFCTHHGFDYDAIEAAMRRNAGGGRVLRGGSTISQQTAKNAFLWQGGGWFRKGLEAWFTLLIERLWGKRRIMEVYLNLAETGIGTYGVDAGARRYFRHGAQSLTPAEAAAIAAVLPLPKKREGVAPAGFTRRYGRAIVSRIAAVRRERLDRCV